MDSLIILQGISVEQLFSQFENILEKKLSEKIAQLKPSKQWRYLTRKEVGELLKISLPTVHNWTKEGFINSYRIGNRVLYKSNEVEAAVKHRKYY